VEEVIVEVVGRRVWKCILFGVARVKIQSHGMDVQRGVRINLAYSWL
jgi:hypothetical protein